MGEGSRECLGCGQLCLRNLKAVRPGAHLLCYMGSNKERGAARSINRYPPHRCTARLLCSLEGTETLTARDHYYSQRLRLGQLALDWIYGVGAGARGPNSGSRNFLCDCRLSRLVSVCKAKQRDKGKERTPAVAEAAGLRGE